MALEIKRILDSRFEFSLDGGDPISDNAPNLTTYGDICHFKTKSGANIIKKQNITYADVTVIDTYGGTGTFTFANIQNLWLKLIDLNFFGGVGGSGGGSGITRFDALLDAFTYFGNNGKVGVVDEAQLKLIPTTFYNYNKLIQLNDVAINSLVIDKVLGVQMVSGVPKVVLVNPSTGSTISNNTKVEKIRIIAEAGDTSFTLPIGVISIDLYKEGQWQIENTDYTYDVNTRILTPDPTIHLNEGDFFEVIAYYVEVTKTQIPATSDNQDEYNFNGIASTVNVILKGSWLIEGTDYTRTYFSTNNKITIINHSLVDDILIGDLVEIITF